MKVVDSTLFADIKMSKVDYGRIEKFLLKAKWKKESNKEHILNFARYHSDPAIDTNSDEFKRYGSLTWQFHFHDRIDILPYLANVVIDRFG